MSTIIVDVSVPRVPPAEVAGGMPLLDRLRRRTAHAWCHHPAGMLGLLVTVAGVVIAVFAPLLAPFDPEAQDLLGTLAPPSWLPGGAAGHLLGTDQIGRDVLSRVIHGARISLSVGFLAVVISAPLGVAMGTVAAYFEGWIEDLVMRLADAQLSIPPLLLAIAMIAVLGPSVRNVILFLGLASWVVYARVARAEVLACKNRDFVVAARASGASDARIIMRHILPNALVSITVIATFAVAHMILVESSLSFLGLGVPPQIPTWGGMAGDSRDYITTAWWLAVFPSLAIAIAVLGINSLGDWLREAWDPRLRG